MVRTLPFLTTRPRALLYQYVPILSTLNTILQHEDVLREVFSSYRKSKGDSLNDGTFFCKNELFSYDIMMILML